MTEDTPDTGDPALLGRTIAGKYVVEAYLGGGAMGAVYRARQRSLDRNVALKVLHETVATDPMFVTRFHREAKAASRLDHPNSMRVVDFGEEPDGLLYIAMEYLEGRDLFHVMHEEWPLSTERIVRVLMQVLAALAVAHDMGVVHRDLKPENIMILKGTDDEGNPTDVVKVCDFGIAKITEPDEEPGPSTGAVEKLTTKGFLVGTPEYMSPEQARGEKLDARSDLYAIGVILYQLLTGRMPFTGDSPVAIILKQISTMPEAPHVIFPNVNRELEAVCMRALAKERDERFASAREMRAALRSALGGKAALDMPTNPPPPADPSASAAAAARPAASEAPPPSLSSTPSTPSATPATLAAPSPLPRAAALAPRPARSPLLVGTALVALAGLAGAYVLARAPAASEPKAIPSATATANASPVAVPTPSATPSASAAEPVDSASLSPSAAPSSAPSASSSSRHPGKRPPRPASSR